MKDRLNEKLHQIANSIYEKIIKDETGNSLGLYSDDTGILLFLLFYSEFSKNKNFEIIAEEYAEKLLNKLPECTSHTFCNGFSGILYAFEYLRESEIIDIDLEDARSVFDNYIIRCMEQDIKNKSYDFMHGALGTGLYFLKKGTNKVSISKLIDYLYETAEKNCETCIFKWKSLLNIERGEIGYNIALSHGMSSIVIFLARAIESGYTDTRIVQMLEGVTNYILLQQKEPSESGSYFPNFSLENENTPDHNSRMAWCYGDLGIAISLWIAGKTTANRVWKNKALEIFIHAAKRRDLTTGFVYDAGICHGSAGIAMIFRRMFIETRLDEFSAASDYWIEQTLNLAKFEDGPAGYKTYEIGKWAKDYSLLTGISGIGMVLMSYIQNDCQQWDELFLLSNKI